MKKIIINEVKNIGLVKIIKNNNLMPIEYVIASGIKKDEKGNIKNWNSGSYFGNDFKGATKNYFERIERGY